MDSTVIQDILENRKAWHIELGDCLEVLKSFPDNCFDSVVTDPPYDLTSPSSVRRSAFPGHYNGASFGRGQKSEKPGKGFMGKEWDGTGIAFKVELWKEVLRVLKPGGHLLSFGGTRTYHRMASAIEDAGFEIRDQIQNFFDINEMAQEFLNSLNSEQLEVFLRLIELHGFAGQMAWIYGSGFPKSLDIGKAINKAAGVEREIVALRKGVTKTFNVGATTIIKNREPITIPATPEAKQWDGWGTALKPANEPIVLARKPLSEATVAANVLRWGTGGLNIDGCRIATNDNLNRPCGTKVANTYNLTNRPEPYIGSEQGRFPANIVFDEEAATLLDEQVGILKSGSNCVRTKTGSFIEHGGLGKPGDIQITYGDSGGASRFFYCSKASKKDRAGSKHPTVKPLSLMRYLCRLVTPPGGIILEPFAGSGTTLQAAIEEGFRVIGIEKEAEYCENISRRMALVGKYEDEVEEKPKGKINQSVSPKVETRELSLLDFMEVQ